ncbi:MAG: helix-turn-helix domain-containing protein [Nostoc indistinguendum CM1-VF10]|jgi:DNA-binding MarR family transcriptional regulator|nr:helix-turn-helix domain-containing protein [Nostoc indistinguendum CM1-VF10]
MSNVTFAQIPLELIRHVRKLKLSGAEYDLWLYLWELDPFGDRWVKIPTPSEIAKHLNVDRRTIQRASNTLQEFGLFEFEVKRWRCKNTTVSTKTKFVSGGKNVRSRTILPTNGSKCPK